MSSEGSGDKSFLFACIFQRSTVTLHESISFAYKLAFVGCDAINGSYRSYVSFRYEGTSIGIHKCTAGELDIDAVC